MQLKALYGSLEGNRHMYYKETTILVNNIDRINWYEFCVVAGTNCFRVGNYSNYFPGASSGTAEC